jgi:hypothetical protein
MTFSVEVGGMKRWLCRRERRAKYDFEERWQLCTRNRLI